MKLKFKYPAAKQHFFTSSPHRIQPHVVISNYPHRHIESSSNRKLYKIKVIKAKWMHTFLQSRRESCGLHIQKKRKTNKQKLKLEPG